MEIKVMETGEAGTMEVKVGAMVEAVRGSATVGEVVEVVEGRVRARPSGRPGAQPACVL